MPKIEISREAFLFLVADAADRLINLGCGTRKSTIQAIEAAIDLNLLKTDDFPIDRSEDGYILNVEEVSRIQQLIISGLLDKGSFTSAVQMYDIYVSPENFPIEVYLAQP